MKKFTVASSQWPQSGNSSSVSSLMLNDVGYSHAVECRQDKVWMHIRPTYYHQTCKNIYSGAICPISRNYDVGKFTKVAARTFEMLWFKDSGCWWSSVVPHGWWWCAHAHLFKKSDRLWSCSFCPWLCFPRRHLLRWSSSVQKQRILLLTDSPVSGSLTLHRSVYAAHLISPPHRDILSTPSIAKARTARDDALRDRPHLHNLYYNIWLELFH